MDEGPRRLTAAGALAIETRFRLSRNAVEFIFSTYDKPRRGVKLAARLTCSAQPYLLRRPAASSVGRFAGLFGPQTRL
jgi:hypothetical protein